ncbi:MAG: hypothetical protein K8S55_08310 [Phycisphaerae bacterium]|nr:hypothetical protein [Phycisphaerae bacterium]
MDYPIEAFETPNKTGALVLSPSYEKGTFDSHAIDCPFPFYHDGRYYMTFIGWDSIGYRTGLASSEDLLHWKKEGMIMDRGPKGSVTEFNVALSCILRDNDVFGPATLKKVDGRFLGTYHAYPEPGYEGGPAVIGLCYSDDLRNWEVCDPILKPSPTCEWESGGLYKSWIMEHDGTYYLFYNAKNQTEWPWLEQTGVAISTDLIHWERYEGNPILKVGADGAFDDLFASDPCVFRHDDFWVMFYFGNCSDGHARDGIAFSKDLLNWEKSNKVLVDVGQAGSIDSRYACKAGIIAKDESIDSHHAHKAGVIAKNGQLFHFYCAVAPANNAVTGEIQTDEIRGIALAVS